MYYISFSNSLLDAYKSLKYSYYHIPIRDLLENFTQDECKRFIQAHYEKGDKRPALELPFLDNYKKNGKHQHTVALYLMGLYLQDLFNGQIWNKLNELVPDHKYNDSFCSWYKFQYTWFMTCLYHDAASCVEAPTKHSLVNRWIYLDDQLKQYNIQRTPFNHEPLKKDILLTRFPESSVKNYYTYRMINGNLDHGIFGGYFLFDRLYKNFEEKTSGKNWDKNDCYIIDKLSYRLEHLDHHAYVADAIICHNIWLASDESSAKEYRKYGLDALIIDGEHGAQKLNIKEYPLQFMLCLLDTIEPVKRFTEKNDDLEPAMEAIDVLKNFYIAFEKPDKITLSCKNLDDKQKRLTKWLNSAKSLSDWMDVTVNVGLGRDNYVTIEINSR